MRQLDRTTLLSTVCLETPRPVDLLAGLRYRRSVTSGSKAMAATARDHAIFEILLAGHYEQSELNKVVEASSQNALGLGSTQFYVTVASILKILRHDRRHITLRELADSCARLRDSVWSLPALKVPKVRMSSRRKELAEYASDDDPDFDPPPHVAPEAVDAERPEVEYSYRYITEGMEPAIRTAPRNLGAMLKAMPDPMDVTVGDDPSVVEFRPITKLVVVEDFVAFELHPLLRQYLSRKRLVRWKRVPFVHLDLGAVASFASPYSAPVYRQLLSQSWDAEGRHIRYDDHWEWSTTLDDFAQAVGYRRQAGGLRGQLERNVLEKILADFASLSDDSFKITVREKSSRSDRELIFDVHLPLPTDLSRFGARKSGMNAPEDPDDPAASAEDDLPPVPHLGPPLPLEEPEPKRNEADEAAWRLWYFRKRMPTQPKPYNLTAKPLRQIRNFLRLDGDSAFCMNRAWRLAIDEIHNANDPYYGNLTGNLGERQYRGARLKSAVRKFGADRAYILFALEEARSPDLSAPATIDRLFFEGTVAAADEDRRLLLAEQNSGFRPARVERVRDLDGLEAFITEQEAGRQQRRDDLRAARAKETAEKIAGATEARRKKLAKRLKREPVEHEPLSESRSMADDLYEIAFLDVGLDAATAPGGKALVDARCAELVAALCEGRDPRPYVPSSLSDVDGSADYFACGMDLDKPEAEDVEEDPWETVDEDLPDDGYTEEPDESDLIVNESVAAPRPAPVASEPVTEQTPRPKPQVPAFLLDGTLKAASPAWTDPYGTAKR